MNKFVSAILIAAAFAYTLIVAFMVLFTIGFGDLGKDLIGLIVFGLIALSPLAVWPYCLRRAAAWRRGEHPPF
ncbi:hypothetical protein [Sphingomonas phyllosphaerae]|uniref:hypothetical protein n=1 Tax=Sphingomonas phyllosphaerae TaxID=257003 RepID=UPI0004915A2B|nr:hypothetical protein [Sphingomonas phyllosphaerae]